ncbi:hypothetical protein [Streptomyces sp. H39-S7]|uniref:hypothetical protein n=1 Tax=Streptomyces sp. H39-S7 TaxID=3004357 RepID=UPI003FA6F41E
MHDRYRRRIADLTVGGSGAAEQDLLRRGARERGLIVVSVALRDVETGQPAERREFLGKEAAHADLLGAHAHAVA